MTKRRAREFYWFAQGFWAACVKLHAASMDRDPRDRRKRTHFSRGMRAAAACLQGDLRRSRITNHVSRVTGSLR